MDFQWQYNHLVIPLSISIVLILLLIALGIRQRHNPTAQPFLFFMICLLIWITTSLLESIILNFQLSLVVADMSFLGITLFPIAWLYLIMVYLGKSKQFRQILPWLLIIPILTNIFIWTNSFHGLWREGAYRDLSTTFFPISIYDYGPWFTVHSIFGFSLAFIAMAMLIRSPFLKMKVYRTQIIILLTAFNLPFSLELLHWMGVDPIQHYNSSILAFPISGLLVSWVMLHHNFLDLMPIARDLVVESMEDLMLVLDNQRRLIDVNPAARARLFQGKSAIIGTSIEDLLPDQSDLIKRVIANNTPHQEIEVDDNNQLQVFEITISSISHPVRDRGKEGWLILLRDITMRKQAEQAFYKQLQQVTILEERQRLARELHDSVNQTLFAARMLADLLPRAIETKPDKVLEYALNIQQLIHGTSAEMRLVLLELYPDALMETDLGTVIKHLCDAYEGSTGTPVDFHATSQIHLEKDAQLTFYRIAQEALHNINKHTEATKVTVNLSKTEDTVKLLIQDNGIGFDPNHIPADHFGLKNMEDRAKSVKAKLSIISELHCGTTITVIGEIT